MKVKVHKEFRDIYTKALHKVAPDSETIIEMTEERFAEAEANLAKYGGGFLEAVDDDVDVNPRAKELEDIAEKLGINKPINQMKTEELESVAKEIGLDLSDAKNNPDRAAALNAWVEAYVKE